MHPISVNWQLKDLGKALICQAFMQLDLVTFNSVAHLQLAI